MKEPGRNPGADSHWTRELFERGPSNVPEDTAETAPDPSTTPAKSAGAHWTQRLFHGQDLARPPVARMQILREGAPWQELELAGLKPETLIGRHPRADIQLEAQRLAMFHACLWLLDDECYIENLDQHHGALLNRKRLKHKHPVRLRDGALVDLPGYQLRFWLPDSPEAGDDGAGLEEVEVIPDFFYTAVLPTPEPSPLPSLGGADALTLTGPLHQVRFTRSGLTVTTDEHTPLLELAEAHGIEIDYSCRAGDCGECMVKCRGEVELKPGCEIPDADRAQGWVYACSSVARSDLEIDA